MVPDVGKQSNVVPVPKSNPPRTIEDDLRPISLTPTLAKHLEWFVGQELLSFVSDKLDAQQFGALNGRSTTHALVDIVHNWNAALDAGSSVRAVFVDYAKAFDHVDHSILLCKLISMGVPAFIIKWIYSFLDKRQQRVKIGNIYILKLVETEWRNAPRNLVGTPHVCHPDRRSEAGLSAA